MITGLNNEQLAELLKMQLETNKLYNTEWDKIPAVKYHMTAAEEFHEFLEEVGQLWNYYNLEQLKFDREAALFEIVDTVHFLLTCSILASRTDTFICRGIYTDYDVYEYLKAMGNVSEFTWPKGSALTITKLYEEVWNKIPVSVAVYDISKLVAYACEALEYSVEDYMRAHRMKNERNRIRAAGGATEGKYDKSQEKPLKL